MCWGLEVTAAMVGGGALATFVTLRRRERVAIPLTLAYFTLMEALQLAGYLVIDQCDSPVNQSVTLLSMLHIVFQPLIINAFAMELVPAPVRDRMRVWVFGLCAAAAVVMLMQLYPFAWAGQCLPGTPLCGARLCTVSGDWHLAWDIPYNGLLVPFEQRFGLHWGFPAYSAAVFLLPLLYGAWRFVVFHALVGPLLAGSLTTNPNEAPAIWCLVSIGILLIALSPMIRRQMSWQVAPERSA
ncbi:DUF5765 domain-containing protein [Paracoccaceae bacterium Fryx2]|nr:DUF5765 domain-containing protein [Paracoccaceae bacterium Fryx2]